MIRSMLCTAAIALWAMAIQPSRAAEFIDGAKLARACTSRAPADLYSCDGYIAGVLDTVSGSVEIKGKMCAPPGIKLSGLRDALGRFGQQHPDEVKGSGVAFLYAMMKAEFPCAAK